jgi:3-phenylpropionate/trans-cinnamate dioxygenase ferredoxin component
MGEFVKVASKSEIADQSAKLVEIEGKRIALFHLGGEFYALDDTCPHAGGPLSEGSIEGEEVECPWHGSRFNIINGEVTGPPALDHVANYNVRVTDDDIEVEV